MGFQQADTLFTRYQAPERHKYISREFQDFGYQLAAKLDDLAHKSLYMRLAKDPGLRPKLEAALRFVIDAPNAKNKAALFMWKLRKLREVSDQEKNPVLAPSVARKKRQLADNQQSSLPVLDARDEKNRQTEALQTTLY